MEVTVLGVEILSLAHQALPIPQASLERVLDIRLSADPPSVEAPNKSERIEPLVVGPLHEEALHAVLLPYTGCQVGAAGYLTQRLARGVCFLPRRRVDTLRARAGVAQSREGEYALHAVDYARVDGWTGAGVVHVPGADGEYLIGVLKEGTLRGEGVGFGERSGVVRVALERSGSARLWCQRIPSGIGAVTGSSDIRSDGFGKTRAVSSRRPDAEACRRVGGVARVANIL